MNNEADKLIEQKQKEAADLELKWKKHGSLPADEAAKVIKRLK